MTEEEVRKIISAAVTDAFSTSTFKDAVVSAMADALQQDEVGKAVTKTFEKQAAEMGGGKTFI